MLRTLIVAGVAAVAGRQLYRSGALKGLGDELKSRLDSLKTYADEKRRENAAAAAHPAAGGPGGGPVRPAAIHHDARVHAPTSG